MTEINWGALAADIEFDEPAIESEGYFIADDRAAGWAMRKIAKINADKKRMLDQIDARLQEITAALQFQAEQVKKKAESDCAYFEQMLAVYFANLPDDVLKRTKAGRISYNLPEGRLMTTAPKREYRHDDARLLEFIKGNKLTEYVRLKEAPDWAAIKKNIRVNENGDVAIVGMFGEVFQTDAIVAVDIPGEFKVEVE